MKKKNLIEHLTEELIKFKAQFATEETTEVESDVEIEASAEEVEVETNEVEVEASAETETEAEVETNEVEIEASAEAEDNSLLGAQGVYAADADGDLDIDIVAAAYEGDMIALWENDGNAAFTKRIVADGFYGVQAARIELQVKAECFQGVLLLYLLPEFFVILAGGLFD